MIEVLNQDTQKTIKKSIDRDTSILIMGRGETDYGIREINSFSAKITPSNLYGECKLVEAYEYAIDQNISNVFLCNIKDKEDFFVVSGYLSDYNFSYVVVLDFLMSDTYLLEDSDLKYYYANYILNRLSEESNTLILFTDKHASLYEDIDHYLDDMKSCLRRVKSTMSTTVEGNNIAFVLNNLENHEYSNLALAISLSRTVIGRYPRYDFGRSIFDLDELDIDEDEMIYFKNHSNSYTTVENLVNLKRTIDSRKVITIDKIYNYIKNNLDLSMFDGQHAKGYQKTKIEKVASDFFESLIGSMIQKYRIIDVRVFETGVFHKSLELEAEIWPINSIEKFSVILYERS